MKEEVPSVGCIGQGFVGSAVADGFKHYTSVKAFDLDKSRCVDSYEDTINQDVLFVCLPTPMRPDGVVDISIIESALLQLDEKLVEIGQHKTVLLKSTCPPSWLENQPKWRCVDLVLNPEFLTERTARLDFQQANRHIFGTSDGRPRQDIISLFEARFPGVPRFWTCQVEASLIKYATNAFFCTKVSFFNELSQVCEAHGLNFESVAGKVMLDQRIGRSHWQTPGHDGRKGFGGSCFPKDINGFIHIAEDAGVDPKVAKAVWEKNLEVRPERDWENLKGRAVSEQE